MKEREAERRRKGGTKEGRRFKFQIRYRIARDGEGKGRESATFFAAALPNGLGGRADGDRVKTIQSQRGIGSDKEGRRVTEGSEGGKHWPPKMRKKDEKAILPRGCDNPSRESM